MIMKKFNLFMLIFIFISCKSYNNINKENVNEDTNWQMTLSEVSIIELLAKKNVYVGRGIVTTGYPSFEFEDIRLYFSKEDYEYMNRINSLEITINKLEDYKLMEYDKRSSSEILK